RLHGIREALSATTRSRASRVCLLPVLEEMLEADVGEWMVEERLDDLRRAGADIGAEPGRLDDVHRMPAACDEHFRGELVVTKDLEDLLHDGHSAHRHIVEPADEGADE